MSAEVLALPHLSVVSATQDTELARIRETLAAPLACGGRDELEALLGALLAVGAPATPKTLDLIGHTTADRMLLTLGDWIIDATSSTVLSFFRGLADQEVLPRLGVHTLRLLGCGTADSLHGRWTVSTIADVLGVEVFGTNGLVFASHYGPDGFDDARRYQLASASELRAQAIDPRPLERDRPQTGVLDLDRLPAIALDAPRAWPVRIADRDEARAVLRLVRRRDGTFIPGLIATPTCELAFPSAHAGRYHRMEVLLGGELVRVYPDPGQPGLVYPVDDASALRSLIAELSKAR